EGQLGAAWLDDKETERELQTDYQSNRWLYSWQHRAGLSSRLLAEVDYTDISDPYYFQDLSPNLGIGTSDFLNQRGSLSWRGDSFTARLAAHAYEMTSVTDVTPYNRMPQLTVNGRLPVQPGGLNFSYGAEYVQFERSLRSGRYLDIYGRPNNHYVPQRTLWYEKPLRGMKRAEGSCGRLEICDSLLLTSKCTGLPSARFRPRRCSSYQS